MGEEHRRVLDMLAEGKLSVDEAQRLLAAIGTAPGDEAPTDATGPRQHLTVTVDPEAGSESASEFDDTFTVGQAPRLIVKNRRGRISVKAGPDNAIRVQTTLTNASSADYQVSQDGDTVTVEARQKGRGSLFGFLGLEAGADITVTVPHETDVELGCTAGRIELSGVEGTAALRATTGRVLVHEVRGDLDAATVTGRVELEDAQGSATLRTTTGRIAMEDVKGQFDAAVTTGSISFNGEMTPGGNNKFKAVTGSVNVKLQGEPSLRIDASCTAGRVSSKLHEVTAAGPRRNRVVGTIGGGEATLLVRTVTGSVSIE